MTSGTPGTPGNPAGAADTATDEATGSGTPDSGTPDSAASGASGSATSGAGDTASGTAEGAAAEAGAKSLTTDTARPEGGGRAAPGDAPAPARQWPLLTVLGLAGIGLVVVGTDPFPQAFRVGVILVGAALLVGAVLRRALPSVGMLAVRSRFTDMITYGVMGALIVFLALMVQPGPWLRIPFLEDVLHLTVT
ncbi:DUF3017 domain-containing protein [Streptomyces sp. SS]|uniref:DUF3017 domain-containing protein n=1 Tax=Streptomyces sp. SS TaxID=260742 RepID=UPI00030E0D9A|nr:DUF3017 domain-containing protein [Streptomyces sp. SS]